MGGLVYDAGVLLVREDLNHQGSGHAVIVQGTQKPDEIEAARSGETAAAGGVLYETSDDLGCGIVEGYGDIALRGHGKRKDLWTNSPAVIAYSRNLGTGSDSE